MPKRRPLVGAYSNRRTFAHGTRFGKWTVIREGVLRRSSSGSTYRTLVCRCDCGTEREVLLFSLLSGNSTNCKCVHHVARKRGLTHRELEAERSLRHKYGIGLDDLAAIKAAQNGRCAICLNDKKKLV